MLGEGGCCQPPFVFHLRDCVILLAKLVAREMNDDGCCSERERANSFSVGRCAKQRDRADIVFLHA